MFRMLSNQHYPHRANQKLRSWANAVFQNRGVCGQRVPSFPSPSHVIHFFPSCPSFLDEPREETLATQAIRLFFYGVCRLQVVFTACVALQLAVSGVCRFLSSFVVSFIFCSPFSVHSACRLQLVSMACTTFKLFSWRVSP